ncbi:putative leucine-rich repeat domain, L domain-containing protein [Rosa chinensis]|uniref:Putative leucine-rich repeat domain, L domain-containing protein n=1 Tax=Rosa chinensis TaxID=74649 RepID=A0A2P6PFT4_ROSCH|nr:putative leucine-rich repeat domain, L domain-containing protein [Rosa chinensis]
MNALRPHENLDTLIIWNYHGLTWPNWMTTSYLTRLTVFHLCLSDSSVLPPLGKLPSLKVVKLMSMYDLKEIGAEFFGVEEETSSSSFPSLETLFLGFLSLEKWELGGKAEDGSSNSQMKSISIMPRLSSLHIVVCDKLKQLPDFLLQNAPLQNLLIKSCQSLPASLPDEFISRIPNVTIEYLGVDRIKGREIDTEDRFWYIITIPDVLTLLIVDQVKDFKHPIAGCSNLPQVYSG